MSLKNTVAVERRMDLASLFCMIGRHGPAVVVAVLALVSVLAALIIYRTVRGKRRRAAAAAADGDAGSRGAEGDAAVIQSRLEESHAFMEATEVRYEGSFEEEDGHDLILSDLKIRHRFATTAAAHKKPPPYLPPKSYIQVPEDKYTTPSDTDQRAAVWDFYRAAETNAKGPSQSLLGDIQTEAQMVEHESNCVMLPGVIHYVDQEQEKEKVVNAEYQEDGLLITDKDATARKTRHKEESSHESVNDDADGSLEANSVESVWEKPVLHLEDTPAPRIGHARDEESEEKNPESVRFRNDDNNPLLSNKEKESACVAEEKGVDKLPTPLLAEMQSTTHKKDTNLLYIQQDQSSDEDSTWYNESVSAAEEEIKNSPTAVGNPLQQCSEGDSGLHDGATVKESPEVVTISALSCVSESIETDTNDVGLSAIITDGKLSSIADFPDFSPDCQQQKQYDIATSMHEGREPTILGSKMVSHESDNSPENKNDPSVMLPECIGHMLEPVVQSCFQEQLRDAACDGENITSPAIVEEIFLPDASSCYREHQSFEAMFEGVTNQASVAVVPDAGENNFFETVEEIPCPHSPLISQDQQCDITEKENLEFPGFASAPDTPACSDVCLSSILTEEETCFPEVLSISIDKQKSYMENTETLERVSFSSDSAACNDVCLTAHLMADEIYLSDVLSSSQDQQIESMINTEKGNASHKSPSNGTNLTTLLISEEISCPVMFSLDQQSDYIKNAETFDDVNSKTATAEPVSPTAEISQSEMLSSCQDKLSDQAKYKDFSEVTGGAFPIMTVEMNPSTCPIYLPCFEQSEFGDNDLSSPGAGKESGISSMAVSPDLQDASHGFVMTTANVVIPEFYCDVPSTATHGDSKNSPIANSVAASYNIGHTADMVFGPYPSRHSQGAHSQQTDWAKYESFAANEDIFGHEIEDSYHREMAQLMTQIVDSVTSLAEELKEETEKKAVVEDLEMKKKKAQVNVGRKHGATEEEAIEYEKTEISIMEATMENNEWITDSNYQVLPWMTLHASSFSKDQQTNQPSTDECSVAANVSCIDRTDDPTLTETKQTNTVSLLDENSENNKKVVAVQPMPQNVNVTFCVHYFTQSPYQTVAVTGNQQELGNWKEFIPLERAKDGNWATVVCLPAESHVEWKFVLLDKGEVCRWEECGNRLLDTGCGDDLIVHKWWGLL